MSNPHPVLQGGYNQNLKPFLKHEDAVERGRKGGLRSQEVQKKKRVIRECLEVLLEMQTKSSDGSNITNAMAMCVAMMEKACKGDVGAFKEIRDTVGEKPTDKQEIEVSGLEKALVEFVDGKGNPA